MKQILLDIICISATNISNLSASNRKYLTFLYLASMSNINPCQRGKLRPLEKGSLPTESLLQTGLCHDL